MNKFKEKKMIITGTIVAMGFLIVAITVPVVLVISNKNKSEDEKNANRKILDKEKARIDSLERFTIKKSVVEISLNSLHSSELELGKVVPGIKYAPTHKQFTKDGNYIVSIKLSISNQSVIATRKIKIEGIDAFKTKMANQQAVNNVAKLFNDLKNSKDGTSSTLSNKSIMFPSSLKDKTTASAIGFLDPSANQREGTNVAFEIASHDDNIGTLVVKATISKGTIKKIVTFKLKDMQTKVRHTLEQEKSRIEGLPIMIIKKSVLSIPLNKLQISDLNLGNINSDIKYEPTHEQFTKDGDYIVSIKLSISSQSVIATRKIKIKGIDAFKTKNANEQAVNNVAQLFNDLKNAQGGTSSTLLNKSSILPSSLKDKTTASAIGFLDPSANQREATNVAFEIASHDDNYGTLVVKATISKGTIKRIVTFKLKDMQTKVQYTLEQEKLRIEGLPIVIIKKSKVSLPSNSLKELDLNLGSTNSDITYEVHHNEFTKDDDYYVSITLSIGVENKIATRKIKIEGIDAFKAKNANEQAVNNVAQLFNDLKNAQGGTSSKLATKQTILPSSLKDKTTASAIGFLDPSADKRNGVNVDFEIASHDDNHGTLVVKATIKKGAATKEVTFTLKDMQTQVQYTLEQEKLRIEGLPIVIIKKSKVSLPSNSLKELDLNLGSTNSDITYEVHHNEFTKDDDYYVSITLSIDSETKIATRKIKIQGIDAFKTKMANQQAVNNVAQLFNDLKNAQGGTNSTLLNKSSILPSSLKDKKTASAIGFLDPSANQREGTNVAFEIASHDDNYGTLVIKATISKGTIKRIVTFKLKDMQTKKQATIKEKQKILGQEKSRIEGLPIMIIKKSVLSIPSNKLQISDLNLGNINSDITYEVNHNKFTKDDDYYVSIKLSIGVENKIAKRKIKIEGIDAFKTKNANEQAVNNVAQLFNDLKNAQGGTSSNLLNKSSILPSSLKDKTTASAIGFLDPSADKRNGVNVDFEIASHDDNHGTLVVKATIKKGAATKEVTFTLKDMQTQVQYTLEQEKLRIEGLPIVIIKKSKVSLPSNSLKELDLNLGSTNSDITYEVHHNEFTKDDDYYVSITLSIGVENKIATRKIKIEGIDAFKAKNANEQAVNNVAQLFNDLKNAQGGTSSKLATKQTILPSSLKDKTTASAIGFLDPSADKRNGVNVDFEIASHDDNHGTLVVKATIKKGAATKEVTFTLKDMQTQVQYTLEQEKLRIEGLPIVIIKKSKVSLPSNSLKELDLNLGSTNSDITYEVHHNEFTKDDDYYVSITLSIGSETKIATRKIKIQGIDAFKTEMANKKAVNDVVKLFNKLKDSPNGTSSQLENKSTIFAFELKSETTPIAIGFVDPSANLRNGTNVVFEVKSSNDYNGTLIVEAKISKGKVSQKVYFKLKDLLTIGKALNEEQKRINNFKYSQDFLEWDIFNESEWGRKKLLLGFKSKKFFYYEWKKRNNGIWIQPSLKPKDVDPILPNIEVKVINLIWLTKASFTLPTYDNSIHGQTKLKDLDLKLKTVSQENIKDLFIKSKVYGLPDLQSYQVYKITVNKVENHDITYKVWVKNRNGQYDTRQFKIEFG